MKKYICIFMIVCTLLSLIGCAKERSLHDITVKDPNNMVESIPSMARAGETVTVKIKDKVAASALVKIKDVEVTRTENGKDKWIFTFVMPDHDIKVDIILVKHNY